MDQQTHSGIWVLSELRHGMPTPATLELLGAAVRLAAVRKAEVTAVLWGGNVTELAAGLGGSGADRVILIEDARFDLFLDELQAETLHGLILKYRPEILLAQASVTGRALMPRVASLCHAGLTADCTELAIDPATGALLQTRPAFGGTLLATIRSNDYWPQMATVRPGVMRRIASPKTAPPRILRESAPDDRWRGLKTVIESFHSRSDGDALEGAGIIVAGGRGMGRNGFVLLRELADITGAAIGASRAAVDANWIAYPHQIGQTGRTIHAQLYLGCGISGQIQHLVGMQNADLIVAVNTDPEAPLMKAADVAVVGDAVEILRHLLQQLRNHGENHGQPHNHR